jgi:PAS domain S-box-containing protein
VDARIALATGHRVDDAIIVAMLPDRRDIEEDASRRLDLSQASIDSLPGVFYVFTIEGKFLRWNRMLEEVSGHAGDEIAHMHPLQFIREEDRESVAASIAETFRSGEANVEARLLSRNGTTTPYFFTGKRLSSGGAPCLIGMGIDVTERRRAIDALRQREEQLRAIIDRSPISMAIVAMDGTIEYINRRAVETFGYLHEDIPVMDRWWQQAYPDEAYRAQVIAQWMGLVERAITLGQEIERREYRVTCKDDTVKTMVIFGVVIAGKVFVMFEDITARKRAEEERARAEEQLHRAQRMEALGTLSGGIAHDFNNILMGVMANAEMLLRKLPEDDSRRRFASEILQVSFRARDLVKQILAFSRREGPERRPDKLANVVDEALKLLHASLPPNIAIRLRVDPRAPTALLERSQVQQVVTNLAMNAAHAIGHAGGTIEISVDSVEVGEGECASRPSVRPGPFVRLAVSDTGSGMTPETLARAFEPFFTTKPVGQGTGLGLAIVHGVMTRHDGFVIAHSTVGAGSTFELYFPADHSAVTASPASATEPPAARGRALRVLLVDDEPVVVRATTEMLEHEGCEVVGLTEPKAALARLQEAPTSFDLAIVDLSMPGMYGDDLARKLHELRSELPILLASGNASRLDPGRLRESGIAEVLAKPFGMKELFEAIGRVVGARGAPRA